MVVNNANAQPDTGRHMSISSVITPPPKGKVEFQEKRTACLHLYVQEKVTQKVRHRKQSPQLQQIEQRKFGYRLWQEIVNVADAHVGKHQMAPRHQLPEMSLLVLRGQRRH